MRTQWPIETTVIDKVDVENLDTKVLLLEILRELRKMNLYLYVISNEEINENDY